jgi:hypothetical protein
MILYFYPPLYYSFHRFISLPFNLSLNSLYLSFSSSPFPSLFLSLSIYLHISLSSSSLPLSLSLYLHIFLSLSISLSLCLSISRFLSVSLYSCLCNLFLFPSSCPSISMSSIGISLSLTFGICLFISKFKFVFFCCVWTWLVLKFTALTLIGPKNEFSLPGPDQFRKRVFFRKNVKWVRTGVSNTRLADRTWTTWCDYAARIVIKIISIWLNLLVDVVISLILPSFAALRIVLFSFLRPASPFIFQM